MIKRIFKPTRTDNLRSPAIPYIGKLVTVREWHENYAMRDLYPNDNRVGFIEEFCLDIPESELVEPQEDKCSTQ